MGLMNTVGAENTVMFASLFKAEVFNGPIFMILAWLLAHAKIFGHIYFIKKITNYQFKYTANSL